MTAIAEQVRILLVEDDDGDALLVEELLCEGGTGVAVERARRLADARRLIPAAACVLLDLGLPDSQGLDGLHWLLRQDPDVAVVVLTGVADEYLGEYAVRAGAQDYLVKGDVSGQMLHRVIRYAMERRRWAEDRWAFAVADNGIGIEPQYADRIFLIFQRLHDRAAYPGTGIGLAMCRKIVEYFGGRIWLDTGATDGTRICFTLPAFPDDEETYD